MEYYKDHQAAFETILKELIELLPSSYNKEVSDTSYYKLLRAFAKELADAKIEIQQIKENSALETVSPEAIFRNFGTLVRLQKNPDWTEDKYKDLIRGVTQSLLKGPTIKSLVEGMKLFTDFKVNIHELYKGVENTNIDPSAYAGTNPRYVFVLEVEKPLDTFADQYTLGRDIRYIINIIKPAHTLTFSIITITGDEDFTKYYADKYGLDRQTTNPYEGMDVVTVVPEFFPKEEYPDVIEQNNNLFNFSYEEYIDLFGRGDGITLSEEDRLNESSFFGEEISREEYEIFTEVSERKYGVKADGTSLLKDEAGYVSDLLFLEIVDLINKVQENTEYNMQVGFKEDEIKFLQSSQMFMLNGLNSSEMNTTYLLGFDAEESKAKMYKIVDGQEVIIEKRTI